MKNVTPNVTDMVTNRFISGIGRMRKFKKMWGTEIVNGVEVFKHRNYFYPSMDSHVTELAKFLGVYNDLRQKQEGIRSAWLFLNPAKDTSSVLNIDRQTIARNLNKAIEHYEEVLTGSIVLGPKMTAKGFIAPSISAPITDEEAFKTEFISRYSEFWDNDYFLTTNQEDYYLEVLLFYVLRSNAVPYEITAVTQTLGSYPVYHGFKIRSTNFRQYKIFINIPKRVYELDAEGNPIITPLFTPSSDIVSMIVDDLTNKANKTTTKLVASAIRAAGNRDIPLGTTDPNNLPDDLEYEALPITLSDLWLKANGTTYLKTSILSASGLSWEDKYSYVYGLIDSDYKKKKVEWYEYAIAVVLVVIISFVTAGTGTAAAATMFTGMMATVASVAVAITLAAMYISLAMAAAHMLGMTGVAAAMGQFLKTAAPLIKIAQIVSYVIIIIRIIQAGMEAVAKKAAEEAAKEGVSQASTATLAELSIPDVVIETVKVGIEELTGIPATGNLNMSHVTKMMDISFGLYQKQQVKKDLRSIRSLQKEYDEEVALLEQSKVSDLTRDMMRAYPNPLTIDHSEYAAIYDKPYEWWSTEFHTGNIQQTTVSGLWST